MYTYDYLFQGEYQQSVQHARLCIDQATFYPILLATGTAVLGQGLVQGGQEGHEPLTSSTSQVVVEPSLLRKVIITRRFHGNIC